MAAKQNTNKKDVFAQIAADHQVLRVKELSEPKPPQLPEVFLPTTPNNSKATFKPRPKMNTASKLQRELERQRHKYATFMQNIAPEIEDDRMRLPLKYFDWRVQENNDPNDFGRVLLGKGKWETVDIPHYGGPLGRAITYYRTTFKLTRAMLAKDVLFICFKGVDYKAHVFINGSYVGSHEGFFAPFEFDFTAVARHGENTIVVKVENDAICMGNDSWDNSGDQFEGDKIYAATGPGYDEPEIGWHHCPPGMGIYQDAFIETRSKIHIKDVFIRPILEEKRAEAWIEVYNCGIEKVDNLSLRLSVFGQNFKGTVFKGRKFEIDYAGPTVNYYRLGFNITNPRIWELESPWLYQVQVEILDGKDKILDTAKRHFGMRSFKMDTKSKPKGKLYFNNHQIRLRGANTMGHMQQCVMKKDFEQLRDDILLAKICNLNFLRLTQRPVQSEIYDYCDKLGLMTQTDLPLFGVLRRNQFAEAVKQAGQMERLVRSHPCNVMVSYINEPFPNASDKPHRYLKRSELEAFFTASNKAVRLANPDRVIKPVDGDYDPPAPGLPDNHCYCGWYNGHGLDLGKLHKGYWQKVKPGWHYACGEFGSEGLDFADVMRKYYPKKWLPENAQQEKTWSPNSIPRAQTGKFHYMWFDTQRSLEDWADASQQHQRWITQLMTEAFRRDSRMNSFAIHLLIDAFPSGWMKTIMDFKRQPKPTYFTYRDALTPLMVSLRTDRYKFFSGQEVNIEAWVCNDLVEAANNCYLHYQLEMDKKIIFARRQKASVPVCQSKFQGLIKFAAPKVDKRCQATIRLGLIDKNSKVLHDTAITIELFPEIEPVKNKQAIIIGSKQGKAARLARELGLRLVSFGELNSCKLILIDDYSLYLKKQREINDAVKNGTVAVFIKLPEGKYKIADRNIEVQTCGMSPCHFVSRDTCHPLVKGFKPDDFKFWYDNQAGFVTPLLETTFTAPGFDQILTSGNGKWIGKWKKALAVAEKKLGKGAFRICQLNLAGRIATNPTAKIFARRLLGLD